MTVAGCDLVPEHVRGFRGRKQYLQHDRWQSESNAGDGGDGYANLVIDKDSTWIVTGDSVLTSLTNNGTITDADGKSVTILDTNGKILANGESGYTITVDSLTE